MTKTVSDRKDAMQSNLKSILAILLFGLMLLTGCAPRESHQQTFVMNTILDQTVYGPEEICTQNADIARELENMLSRTLDSSEIYMAVHTDGAIEVSEETAQLVGICLEEYTKTEGAFDPSLGALRDLWGFGSDRPAAPDPDAVQKALAGPRADAIQVHGLRLESGGADIDLGGAAKGFALDAIRENMTGQHVSSALISFGGAVWALGSKPDGTAWRVGVRDPFSADNLAPIAKMDARNIFIETSGISQQSFEEGRKVYHHILDPQTGFPADSGLAAVTICSDSGTLADIYSTALFVMGEEEGMRFATENDIAAMFITTDKRILLSPAFTWELHDIDEEYTLVQDNISK